MKYFSNQDVANLLNEIAAAHTVKKDSHFQIMAYSNAADSIEQSPVEVTELWKDGRLNTVPGLGKGIQSSLDELFRAGKVRHFDQVKKGLPEGMFKILNIKGMGPKKAYKLAKEFNIKNAKDLANIARKGKIRDLAGFGLKSEQEILESATDYKGKPERILLSYALSQAEQLINYLKANKYVSRVETLGSLRRRVSTVGDIDIAVASDNAPQVIKYFKKYRPIKKVLGAGSIASTVILGSGVQVDLKVLPKKTFGSLLQHFTGSKNHNIALREYALSKNMSLSEHGIKHLGKIHKFTDEEEFYQYIGLHWIEPELRENLGEIELALQNKLPKLVKVTDIKGDLHTHSSYPIEPGHDIGKNSYIELVEKAKQMKYEYIGLSDHSPSNSRHSETQVVDILKRRDSVIEQIKSSQKNIRILKLLEIDILIDGELSVPKEGLKLLNGSIAGIHSGHSQNKKQITTRLLNAISSEHVSIISHPAGRLIQKREPYEADWPKIFEACKNTGTILEINSWPLRLDLPDILVKEAISHGVKLVINSDAHETSHMDNIPYGISVARRGWAQKKDIINTRPWVEIAKLFKV